MFDLSSGMLSSRNFLNALDKKPATQKPVDVEATSTEYVLNDCVNVLMYTCIDALAFENAE